MSLADSIKLSRGSPLGVITRSCKHQSERIIRSAKAARHAWRCHPNPHRGIFDRVFKDESVYLSIKDRMKEGDATDFHGGIQLPETSPQSPEWEAMSWSLCALVGDAKRIVVACESDDPFLDLVQRVPSRVIHHLKEWSQTALSQLRNAHAVGFDLSIVINQIQNPPAELPMFTELEKRTTRMIVVSPKRVCYLNRTVLTDDFVRGYFVTRFPQVRTYYQPNPVVPWLELSQDSDHGMFVIAEIMNLD